MTYSAFKNTVWKYYHEHGRSHLPWRKTHDPYKILISEIMLQQTQVGRVIPKYSSFLKAFPTLKKLSSASLRAVIAEWQGLGYNRRAINLKRAAEIIVKEYKGAFPTTLDALVKLPGIGRATAGDILAFAFNTPAVVIETNIRTVYIHHFFKDTKNVSDADLLPVIEKTLDHENPREWYWALMDYGAHLKTTLGNNITQSKHYKKQSKFKGSNRELRSKILKAILRKSLTEAEIIKLFETPAEPVRKNLLALEKEGLVHKIRNRYTS